MTLFEILDWIEKHPGTASWVQAVGSIAAIAAAAFIASHQNRIENRRRKQDELERSSAKAGRLYLFANELCEIIKGPLDAEYQQATESVDLKLANVFDRMMIRLNQNFDDDLDAARNVQVNTIRACLTGLIFLLESSKHTSPEDRRTEIQRYKELAPKVLLDCAKLLHSPKR